MGIWYATLEDVQRAVDAAASSRSTGQVSRAIDSASRAVEGMTRRVFYPTAATRYFDWPARGVRPWRLWLNHDEVVEVTQLVAGGVAIPAGDYFLEPANSGPPFTHVEIDLGGPAAFSSGDTHQRAIAITGVFGYTLDESPAGALVGALDDSTSAATVSDSSMIGVGSILRVGDERLVVTAKRLVDTGQTLQADLTNQNSDVTVTVTDGTGYAVDEVVLLDSERMLIVDIAGNNLIVKRAWGGSVLDAHSGSTIYAPRDLGLVRGALGTTAAPHADATQVWRHDVPALIRELTVAEAINTIQQEQAGYGRTIGSGESEREAGGRGLRDIRTEAVRRFGRRARTGAV